MRHYEVLTWTTLFIAVDLQYLAGELNQILDALTLRMATRPKLQVLGAILVSVGADCVMCGLLWE